MNRRMSYINVDWPAKSYIFRMLALMYWMPCSSHGTKVLKIIKKCNRPIILILFSGYSILKNLQKSEEIPYSMEYISVLLIPEWNTDKLIPKWTCSTTDWNGIRINVGNGQGSGRERGQPSTAHCQFYMFTWQLLFFTKFTTFCYKICGLN